MKINVIIPSCKQYAELRMLVSCIRRFDTGTDKITYFPTGFDTSAAVNRNFGMMLSSVEVDKPDYIIMIDDDIGGFFEGWQQKLIEPLLSLPEARLSAARLMTPEGTFSAMMGSKGDVSEPLEKVYPAVLSAVIAFRTTDVVGKIWFDNLYIGSGFEDTDFCYQLLEHYPNAEFVINNDCRLIHYHEMKNQSPNHEVNKGYFVQKWGRNLRGLVI